MMRIDAHHHLWDLSRGGYDWLSDARPKLHRTFMPAEFDPLLKEAGIDKTILVQSTPSVAESEFLLELAAKTDFVAGVVGWVDFEAENAVLQLSQLSLKPFLVGIRGMMQMQAAPDWVLNPGFAPVFETLIELDLSFDALIRPIHLPVVTELAQRHPNLRIVVNHGGKPEIRQDAFSSWALEISRLSQNRNVFCKLSGLLAGMPEGAKLEGLSPYVDHIIQTFGPSRTMWGSDWPVLEECAPYATWYAITETELARHSAEIRQNIYADTAIEFYRLPPTPEPTD
ncbi:amidohydrolase family protein [Roseibium sp. SCP14]|uniref:amidohydrolase family protein n=1 Tax=Roseibium sp. SCP14 TaxID=3141375 RepID=UPI0033395382